MVPKEQIMESISQALLISLKQLLNILKVLHGVVQNLKARKDLGLVLVEEMQQDRSLQLLLLRSPKTCILSQKQNTVVLFSMLNKLMVNHQ